MWNLVVSCVKVSGLRHIDFSCIRTDTKKLGRALHGLVPLRGKTENTLENTHNLLMWSTTLLDVLCHATQDLVYKLDD